nr:Gag protein [Tanacetum cinerariifolium]
MLKVEDGKGKVTGEKSPVYPLTRALLLSDTEEAPSTIPLSTPEEEHNGSDPASEDRTRDRSLENTSGDPVMQFVVQNFKQINAMYSAFS